ncbi:MAG: MFS transporter [Roseinatronobacter sp.]
MNSDPRNPISPHRALGVALSAQTLAMLPVFLMGSMAPFLMVDLGLNVFQLGLVIAAFYGASAIGSATLAGLSDRSGTWWVTLIALIALTFVGFAMALVAQNGWSAAVLLSLAGLANGCIQPATNVMVSRFIPSHRQGLAYGLKQSAVPLATLIGGISVPLVVLFFGWRAAFALTGIFALAIIAMIPRDSKVAAAQSAGESEETKLPRSLLFKLALMSGLGAACANAMAGFLVPSITRSGFDPAMAGLTLAAGSVLSIIIRICAGHIADRHSVDLFKVVTIMFVGGAFGYMLLAISVSYPIILIATLLAFGMGWGWSGISILGIARASAGSVGAATGFTQSGVYIGAVIGPALFGWIAETLSFSTAWAVLSIASLGASLAAFISAREMARHNKAIFV